jgi:integrase
MPKKVAKRKVVLTDKMLKALEPAAPGTRLMVWDAACPHLGVRVTEQGARSFVVVRRRAGDAKLIFHVLGRYPGLSLAKARERTPGILGTLAEGHVPREEEAKRLRAEARRRKDTFAAVAEDFIKLHIQAPGELRGAREYEAIVRRELIGRWGKRPLTRIERSDVLEMLDEIKGRGAPYAAHHAFAAARKLFNWALDRDTYGIETNPCSRIDAKKAIGKSKARSRVLSDDEIRIVWKATLQQGHPDAPAALRNYPFGALVEVLLLTGQRLREIADARWSEIDLKAAVLTVPEERMKAKVTHAVPLTPRVMKILSDVPRFKHGSFVFSTTDGRRPVSGFSKMKERLDRAVDELAKSEGYEHSIIPFTLHDLRRTVRTRLRSLGVLSVVAELVIGHTQTGIHKVYDLHRYDAEKRDALTKWETCLLGIVEPHAREGAAVSTTLDNVLPLKRMAKP